MAVTQPIVEKQDEVINTLTKVIVQKRVDCKEYSLRKVVKRNVKNPSPVWDNVMQVCDQNGNELKIWFCCTKCIEVIKNETSATTPFLRHVCKRDKNQLSIKQFASSSKVEKEIKISAEHQKKMKDGCAQMICCDLRPFSAVEGKGFREAMYAAIELGQAYPDLPRSKFPTVIPGRSTSQRYIELQVDTAAKTVKERIQKAYALYGGFACTSDLWTDQERQKVFISITGHILVEQENGIVVDRMILAVEEVVEAVKTKAVVERYILDTLSSYGFTADEVKDSIYFVTDRGSQFKTTDKFKRANCYPHMLHNIVKATCKDHEVAEIITNAKSLVRYIKRAGLNYRCDLRLKSYCETRWSTVYTMLNSIVIQFDNIYKVLEERQKQNKRHSNCLQYIECLHKSTLSKIVDFLQPFKMWTDFLEADKCVSLHRVWPTHMKVNEHLKVAAEEDFDVLNDKNFKIVEAMKSFGRDYVRSIFDDFTPTVEHNIAIALHPRMKKLKKLAENTRESTYDVINNLISNNGSSSPILPPKEKKRAFQNLMDEFADSDDEEQAYVHENTYCKELEEYLRLPSSDDARFYGDNDSDALCEWWQKHKTQFPNLFKLFMKIATIPASSAPSERCFSVTGQIITERRSCISSENVSNVMLCRNMYL